MTKPRVRKKSPVSRRPVRHLRPTPREVAGLRRRLAKVEAELEVYRGKQEWLIGALAAQRQARQLLEAGVAASYPDTIARIREVVSNLIPPRSTMVVVSKGDQELVRFPDRNAWHFPQTPDGVYAGHHPADSAEAIEHLKSLIARGGEFLLLPNTAFWWLEHYRELKDWLAREHTELWRDEKCAIYRLCPASPGRSERAGHVEGVQLAGWNAPTRIEGAEITNNGLVLLKGPAEEARPDVICFPIIDWGFRFQRPQQLMRRFATAGHRVFYLSHQFRKAGPPFELHQLEPSLWEVTIRGPAYNVRPGLLDEGSCEALSEGLRSLCADRSIERALTMVQAPYWWPLARQVAAELGGPLIYDCMDLHAGFPTYNPLLGEQEQALIQAADLVIASSAPLQTHARKRARKVVLVRNGCDYDHFAQVAESPRGARPVVGYYGAIAEWFDADLVGDLAESRPDWEFVLVGSTFGADVGRLSRLPNVSLAGEQPYAAIPAWLAKFDVAILPFKVNPLTEAANPVKAYEILAGGKPLVAVPLPELVPLKPLVRLAATAAGFEREIMAELTRKNAPAQTNRRRAFARGNTWEKRFEELSRALRPYLAKTITLPPPSARTSTAAAFV